ncbi:MAG: hypothetical protein [Bacteriophage sp.]|nr:MAG: hypothetical protein [Bacteriophage sp.]
MEGENTMNLPFFNKKQVKKFKQTAYGFVSWGAGCREVYFNLYEDNKGSRQSKLFHGRELQDIPENADFSVVAQVDGWVHGGDLPKSVFNPLGEKVKFVFSVPLSKFCSPGYFPDNTTNKLETRSHELNHWGLTERQIRMIKLFCSDELVTKIRLCDEVTFDNYLRPTDAALAVLVSELRKKIAPHGMKIKTKPKQGYYLEDREHWRELLTFKGRCLHTVWGNE